MKGHNAYRMHIVNVKNDWSDLHDFLYYVNLPYLYFYFYLLAVDYLLLDHESDKVFFNFEY